MRRGAPEFLVTIGETLVRLFQVCSVDRALMEVLLEKDAERRKNLDASPLERFLVNALADFEKYLKGINLKEDPLASRMRRARQFADFFSGRSA
jgi:hypothetical protein